MENKKISKNDIVIIFEGFITCIFLILPQKLKIIFTSFHIHILLSGIILLIIFNINTIFQKNKRHTILLVLVEIVILLISILRNNGGLGSLEFFISIVLILLIGDSVSISKQTIKLLGIVSTICWILANVKKMNDLNTNVASYQTFMLYVLMLPFIHYNIKSNIGKYVLLVVSTIIMIINSMYYDCRTVLAATIILFLFNIIPLKIWKLSITKKILFFTITFGGLIVVAIYLYLYNNGINIDMSDFSNKSLYSGREVIWTYMLNQFTNGHLLFGIGSNFIQYGFSDIGIHNYMLNILVVFGSINFIIYMYMLYVFIEKLFNKEIINKNKIIYISEIITIFLIEFFETHLISAYSLAVLFLLTIFYYNEYKLKDKGR